MWSSDFRHIGYKGESGRPDSLFRASVSAFCSLTRPTRRDAAQLEDLALPLLESVSAESRRYVSAALSECAAAPHALVRRLCEEPVEIAAPLLVRSAALTEIDLIALIGRHGMPHARAIARRAGLNKTIGDLIRALEGPRLATNSGELVTVAPRQPTTPPAAAEPALTARSAEGVRERLRSMMRPAKRQQDLRDTVVGAKAYPMLRDTALAGNDAFFHTALADALCLDFGSARAIAESDDPAALPMSLRALDLGPEKAFLITAAVQPARFRHAESVRLFVERYRLATREGALARLQAIKEGTVAPVEAANQDARQADPDGRLRAS